MSPGSETDHFAADAAHDVAIGLLDTMQLEYGVTAKATEEAAKVLLLAAAFLRWDITISGRGELVSTMLLASLDETRDDMVGPQTSARGAADRLAAATSAGIRGEDHPTLTVPRGMVEVAQGWLKAFAPSKQRSDHDDDSAAPTAA